MDVGVGERVAVAVGVAVRVGVALGGAVVAGGGSVGVAGTTAVGGAVGTKAVLSTSAGGLPASQLTTSDRHTIARTSAEAARRVLGPSPSAGGDTPTTLVRRTPMSQMTPP